MDTDLKPVTIRLIVPKTTSNQVRTVLGPGSEVEVSDLVLKTQGLTTADTVRHIREYDKLRDEVWQTLRQTGTKREAKPMTPDLSSLDSVMEKDQGELDDVRNKYQRLQSETQSLEREIEDVNRQIALVDQLSETGFSYDEISSQLPGFRRILGKLPAKKLDPARKALRALLKERTVVATGARKQDWVYLLVASPSDAASQAQQTLLLYDFIPTDMPSLDGGGLTETVQSWRDKKDRLSKKIGERQSEWKVAGGDWGDSLNRLADRIQETILTLRSVLRLGEGVIATHIFARLKEPTSQETLDALARGGVLELDTS